MQRKNSLHRDTSSVRIARAAQLRLDEISDKIERDKHKRIKSNYHEKVKIWNELKSIHRVFEPLYVIKENQARLVKETSLIFQNWTQKLVCMEAMGCEKIGLYL